MSDVPLSAKANYPYYTRTHYDQWLEMAEEIDKLRAWKNEAMRVLNDWEDVWIAAGEPGPLGTSKAAAVLVQLARLRNEVERLSAPPTRIPPVVAVPLTGGDIP